MPSTTNLWNGGAVINPQQVLDALGVGEVPDFNVRVGLGNDDGTFVALEFARAANLSFTFALRAAVRVDADDEHVRLISDAGPDVCEQLAESVNRSASPSKR